MQTTHAIDLTPFGFTPTESQVYWGLLELGPSSGYGVAKALNLARANAYQALDGLVSKRAGVVIREAPRMYRAVSPEALLALITAQETEKLQGLERAVARVGIPGEPTTVPFTGDRRLEQLALRTAARAASVRCAAPPEILKRLVPLWRKRETDQVDTQLYAVGDTPHAFPVPLAGSVAANGAGVYFAAPPILLVTPGAAIAALASDEVEGLWTSENLLVGLVRAALEALVRL